MIAQSVCLQAAPRRADGPKRGRRVTAAATKVATEGLNKYSSRITQPRSQGASQAMLYATGLKEEDLNKPQVRRGPGGPRVGDDDRVHAAAVTSAVYAGLVWVFAPSARRVTLPCSWECGRAGVPRKCAAVRRAYRVRVSGWHFFRVVRGQPLQHAPDAPGRGGEARRGGGRHGGIPIQHDRVSQLSRRIACTSRCRNRLLRLYCCRCHALYAYTYLTHPPLSLSPTHTHIPP